MTAPCPPQPAVSARVHDRYGRRWRSWISADEQQWWVVVGNTDADAYSWPDAWALAGPFTIQESHNTVKD